jgi:PD-(D/E)XK nuclease superfamily
MDTNQKMLLKEEVYHIVGCALEVLNGIGHGLHEKPYENALVVDVVCPSPVAPRPADILQQRKVAPIRVYSRPFAVSLL